MLIDFKDLPGAQQKLQNTIDAWKERLSASNSHPLVMIAIDSNGDFWSMGSSGLPYEMITEALQQCQKAMAEGRGKVSEHVIK